MIGRIGVSAARRLLMLTACVGAAGCGGATLHPGGGTAEASTSSSPAASPGADPCTLMTAEEASAIAGTPMVGEGSQPRGELRECQFLGGPASLFVELQQSNEPGALMATYEAFETQLAGPASNYRITQLPDVANGAFMAQADIDGTTAAGIYVIDGTSFFDIACSTTPGCDAKELMAGEAFAAGQLSAATS